MPASFLTIVRFGKAKGGTKPGCCLIGPRTESISRSPGGKDSYRHQDRSDLGSEIHLRRSLGKPGARLPGAVELGLARGFVIRGHPCIPRGRFIGASGAGPTRDGLEAVCEPFSNGPRTVAVAGSIPLLQLKEPGTQQEPQDEGRQTMPHQVAAGLLHPAGVGPDKGTDPPITSPTSKPTLIRSPKPLTTLDPGPEATPVPGG